MRKALLISILFAIASILPAIAQIYSDYDPLEKVEKFTYNSTSISWNLLQTRKWHWHDSVIVNIDDYVNDDITTPVFRKRFTFNEQKKPLEIIIETYDAANDLWLDSSKITYSYDLKGRLMELVNYRKADMPFYKYDYFYNNDGQEVIRSDEFTWQASKNEWYKSGSSTVKYNAHGKETELIWSAFDSNGVATGEEMDYYHTYTSFDSLEREINYFKANGTESGNYGTNYYYNSSNILIRSEGFYEDQEEGDIVNSVTDYYYENGKTKELVTKDFSDSSFVFELHEYENNDLKHTITSYRPFHPTDSNDTEISSGRRYILYYATDLAVNDLKPAPNDMSVSPNPCQKNGEIHVILPEISSGSVDFLFYDMQGCLLYSVNYSDSMKNYTIPCPDVPAGAYFIRAVSDGKDVGTGKLVID